MNEQQRKALVPFVFSTVDLLQKAGFPKEQAITALRIALGGLFAHVWDLPESGEARKEWEAYTREVTLAALAQSYGDLPSEINDLGWRYTGETKD